MQPKRSRTCGCIAPAGVGPDIILYDYQTGEAAEGLAFCYALFEVERKWKDETSEQRYEARLADS